MSERRANQSRPSRWDALAGSSSSSSAAAAAAAALFSSSRGRLTNKNDGKSDATSSGGRDRHVGRWGGGANRIRHGNTANEGNWRWRRAANNDLANDAAIDVRPDITAEEEEANVAMGALQIAADSFLAKQGGETGGESAIEGARNGVIHSIEQLGTSLFGADGETKTILEHPTSLHEINSIQLLPNIRNGVIWEAAYSLLRSMRLLSQPRKRKSKQCSQFILSISSMALICLQSLIHSQQQSLKEQKTRKNTMTDLRLCECASILLDALECDCLSLHGDATGADEILSKATLFSCLAKILSMSTMIGHASSPNDKERRGPLFAWGAEKTVNLVVKQAALPFLESLTNSDGATVLDSSDVVVYCHGAMECLYLLLRDPLWGISFEGINHGATDSGASQQLSRHAAAILAPLVVDVSPDGREKQRANPLRPRTLNAIVAFWKRSLELVQNEKRLHGDSDGRFMAEVTMPCQCLAAAFNALAVLRKGKAQSNQTNSYEMDVPAISRYLQSMIQDKLLESLRSNFFDLLTLLCLAHPSASASQWHLFLEKSRGTSPPLISIFTAGTCALDSESWEDKSWIALPSALHATSTLLTAMPFKLWISAETRTSMRMSGGNFSSRVRKAVLDAMGRTLDLLTAIKSRISCEWLSNTGISPYASSMEKVVMQLSLLAGKLCTVLPFTGENFVLLQPASRLVQCAGDIYVHSARAIATKPSMAKLEFERTLLYKAMSNFGNVIVESLRVDPSSAAQVEPGSTPADKWLSEASSYDFIGLLLTDACWSFPSSSIRLEMLSSVAKRSPLTLAREPFNLATFCEVCAVQCKSYNNADLRIQGLKLIESFILGRKIFHAEFVSNSMIVSVVPETLHPLLLVALEDNSAAVRSCAVSSYGSLLKHDWVELFLSNAQNVEGQPFDWTSLESILRLCSAEGEKNAGVRSSSCKAVGDICTACIGGILSGTDDESPKDMILIDDFVLTFTCKICEVMLNALDDKHASVRSMALFAFGNTAAALKEHCSQVSAPASSSLKNIFPSVCACLRDKDEKVVANAIRSIGHIAYFVYHPDFATSVIEESNSETLDGFRSLLTNLSSKIEFALNDAAGESPMDLTWKQRNGAKKHAWGSCTTLGMLLSFSNLLPYLDDSIMESALSSLFRCVELSNKINEKITAASITALTKLPNVIWRHLSGRCDFIGLGLATCFGFLHKKEAMASQRDDVESLTNVLLATATKSDFCNLFLLREVVPYSVDQFYQFLVTHDTEGSVLEKIAAAASSQSVDQTIEVSAVQMFVSRTIQQNRRQGSLREIDAAALRIDENEDDDGDEL